MATQATPVIDAKRVPVSMLVRGDNPRRKKPAQEYVQQIADSMAKHDVIEPLIVRPWKDGAFQIVCGSTRFDAALLAGLMNVPVVVRDYGDDDVLEVQLIENIQRNNMHPIDEGEAFKRLIERKKHTPETLAKAIGKSVRWVYNRLEFTKLIPSLRDAFLAGEITVSHAELLARLEPVDQKRIDNGTPENAQPYGLWRWDHLKLEGEGADRRSARSIRDVHDWIEHNVRLAIQTTAVQRLLPEVDDVQVEAQVAHSRVLQVATAFILPQDPELKKRFEGVLTDRHWQRAGGKSKCDHAEKAVIVYGDGQGTVLDVCVSKKLCAKHWPDHQPAAVEKRQKARARQAERPEEHQIRAQSEQAARAKLEARWLKWRPAMNKAAIAQAHKLKTVPKDLLQAVLRSHNLPQTSNVVDIPKLLMLRTVDNLFSDWSHQGHEPQMRKFARMMGVDVKAVDASIEPKPEPEAKPTKKPARESLKKDARPGVRKALAKRKAGKKR